MRIVALDKESKQSILNDLLKRSPNNYSQYESTVNPVSYTHLTLPTIA